jgi:phosphatidylinositol alpha-mannosyltransferase
LAPKSLNIGLVSPYDYSAQGGVTEHIKHLSQELRGLGHTTKIIAPFSAENEEIPEDLYALGAVTSIPAKGTVARISLSPDLGRTIKAILRTERFDVVHLHEPLMPAVPISVLRYSNSTNVGTFHAFGESFAGYAMGKPILRRFFDRLDGRIAVSPAAMEYVSQYFGSDYEIIPNGVDVSRFSADLPPILGMRDGRPTILFVGRFEESRKGLKWLLQALPIIEPYFPDLRLIVAGSGDPDEMAEWLPLRDYSRQGRVIYRSAGSALEVEFTGFVSAEDLPRYYQSCDIYCAPSTGGESFGVVLLEAMASGVPILAGRITGYSTVLTHGREGFLAEPKDPASIAAGIIRLLSDPTLRQHMGAAGRRTARQYDWPIVAGRVLAFYEKTIARVGRTATTKRSRSWSRLRPSST